MKVDNPVFIADWLCSVKGVGEVGCRDCPFEADGISCYQWLKSHRVSPGKAGTCPTAETYAEACQLAEEMEATS